MGGVVTGSNATFRNSALIVSHANKIALWLERRGGGAQWKPSYFYDKWAFCCCSELCSRKQVSHQAGLKSTTDQSNIWLHLVILKFKKEKEKKNRTKEAQNFKSWPIPTQFPSTLPFALFDKYEIRHKKKTCKGLKFKPCRIKKNEENDFYCFETFLMFFFM